jgi:hypothetical protein
MMIDEMFVYLAVAESGQFFTIFLHYLLSERKQEMYIVCPCNVILSTNGESHCLIALFLGKEETTLRICKRLVMNNSFKPIWIRSPDTVIGNTDLILLRRPRYRVIKQDPLQIHDPTIKH